MRYRTISQEMFDFLVSKKAGRQMAGESTEAAKEVLVDGSSITESAQRHQLSSAAVSAKVKRILEREQNVGAFKGCFEEVV